MHSGGVPAELVLYGGIRVRYGGDLWISGGCMRVAIPERDGVTLWDLGLYLQFGCVSYIYICSSVVETPRNPKQIEY